MTDRPAFGRRDAEMIGSAPSLAPPSFPGAAAPSSGPGRPSILRRLWLYSLLALIDLVAMREDVFTLSVWLLAPWLILIVVHWATLYLPLIDWPLTVWRRTRQPLWVVAWLAAALAVPVGGPLVFNVLQDQAEARDRAADLTPAAQLAAPRTILLSERECQAPCQALFASGLVDHVVLAGVASVSPGRPGELSESSLQNLDLGFGEAYLLQAVHTTCEPWARLPGRDGWCLIKSRISHPRYDAIVDLNFSERLADVERHRQVAIWTCHTTCVRVAQRTQGRGDRLAIPLRVDYVSGSLKIDPRFHRQARASPELDPVGVLGAVFALPPAGGGPRQGPAPADIEAGMPGYAALRIQAEAAHRANVAASRLRDQTDQAERLRQEAVMRKVEADRELRRQCFKAASASETDALLIEDCRAKRP